MVQAALKNPFAVGVSLIKTYFHSMNDVNAALAEITSLTYSNPCYLPPGGVPPNHHHVRGSEPADRCSNHQQHCHVRERGS